MFGIHGVTAITMWILLLGYLIFIQYAPYGIIIFAELLYFLHMYRVTVSFSINKVY